MWYVNVLMKRKGRLAKRVVDINMVFFNSLRLKRYTVANDGPCGCKAEGDTREFGRTAK